MYVYVYMYINTVKGNPVNIDFQQYLLCIQKIYVHLCMRESSFRSLSFFKTIRVKKIDTHIYTCMYI